MFIDHKAAFIARPEFIALMLAMHRNPVFDILRPGIRTVLSDALLHPDDAVAAAAFAAFCAVPFTLRDIPSRELLARVNDGRFPVETIELFARLPQMLVSTRLINALLLVGKRSPLTACCFCRIALTLEGARAMLEIPRWMDEECLALSDAVLLLLVICRFAETRDALADAPEFPDFAIRVLNGGAPKEIAAVVVVLRKMRACEALVRNLDRKGFFEIFFPRAVESRVPALQDAALLLAERVVRVVWLNGFVWLMQYLPSLIGFGGALGRKSLIVTLLLTAHPQAKGPFRQLNLAPIVAGCEMDGVDRSYKTQLLAYLSA
jgi:hypothetical protein